jgi:branched-chain amino acid transport system substrate-binding protein
VRFRTIYLLLMVFILASYPLKIRANEIKIGLVFPLTGPLATEGMNLKKAAEIAVQDINKSGGILGKSLRLVIEDDSCDSKKAVHVAHKLVDDKVVFVVGHLCSATSIAASSVYLKNRVIQMSLASESPMFTERDYEKVFRLSPRSDEEGEFAGEYMGRIDKGYPIGIYYEDTTYGKYVAEKVKDTATKYKASIQLFENFPRSLKDTSYLTMKMKSANIKVLYFIGASDIDKLNFVRRVIQDKHNTLVIINRVKDKQIFQELRFPPKDEKILMTALPDFTHNKMAISVVDKFVSNQFKANNLSLFAYSSIQIFAAAATNAGKIDYNSVIEKLKAKQPFNTIIGDISFDSKGNAEGLNYIFYELKDGQFVAMNTRPTPPPPPPK